MNLLKYFLIMTFFIGINCAFGDTTVTPVEIPSSFNPVGSGAKALGMSAFIASSDDATAASWNPGALSILEQFEISVVGSFMRRKENTNLGNFTISESELNYMSIVYPFYLNRIMVVALTYQRLYDLNRNWEFYLVKNKDNLSYKSQWHYNQEGSLSAIGLSYCTEVTPNIYFGGTINFWNDNQWTQDYLNYREGFINNNPFKSTYRQFEEYSFKGLNVNLGILWHYNDDISFGAVYKTKFEADIEHKIYLDNKKVDHRNEKMKMPESVGFGVAFKVSKKFRLSSEIYKTYWNNFVYTNQDGTETNPITGRLINNTNNMKPTYQLRLGGEYKLIVNKDMKYAIPIRAGIFYDPIPSQNNPDDVYGLSIGIGFSKIAYFSFDISYQYRFGNNIGDSYMDPELNFEQNINESNIYLSLILYSDFMLNKYPNQ